MTTDPTAPISSLLDAPEIDLPPGFTNMVRIYRLLPGQLWGEMVPVAVFSPPPTDAERYAEARAEIERLTKERDEARGERDELATMLEVAQATAKLDKPTRPHRPAEGWVPDDGHEWFEHTPGDPCPVPGDVEAQVVLRSERRHHQALAITLPASRRGWSCIPEAPSAEIVAWRPA